MLERIERFLKSRLKRLYEVFTLRRPAMVRKSLAYLAAHLAMIYVHAVEQLRGIRGVILRLLGYLHDKIQVLYDRGDYVPASFLTGIFEAIPL